MLDNTKIILPETGKVKEIFLVTFKRQGQKEGNEQITGQATVISQPQVNETLINCLFRDAATLRKLQGDGLQKYGCAG
jgi:hypothetical protein